MEFSLIDFALPLDLGDAEKTLAPPITVHACGCTCQCSGTYCTHDLASNCGNSSLAPFDAMSCHDHRAEINNVLKNARVSAMLLSCNGTIAYKH
ncbi:hypothetical protein KFE25_010957 [Diacronema lutheri]|uniref:Uncharacterized protein n=1 Tax=Diacronema lutheri TaxID=2081491 RepID=A0A8J6C9Y6_DIALT|nr:hypothetical protein KFE25_010957 [Diacronema lutheri]